MIPFIAFWLFASLSSGFGCFAAATGDTEAMYVSIMLAVLALTSLWIHVSGPYDWPDGPAHLTRAELIEKFLNGYFYLCYLHWCPKCGDVFDMYDAEEISQDMDEYVDWWRCPGCKQEIPVEDLVPDEFVFKNHAHAYKPLLGRIESLWP